MKNTAYIRYTVALVALMLGFAFSIRFGERGFLFESTANDALATPTADDGEYDLQALAVLNQVVIQLKDNYVDPARIDPERMLFAALDSVQNSVPEVVTHFDTPASATDDQADDDQTDDDPAADDEPTADGEPTAEDAPTAEDDPTGGALMPIGVEVHVGSAVEHFDVSRVDTLWEVVFKVREIFRFLQQNIDPAETDLRDVEYAAINGMLGTLDPHSVLLRPDVYAEMQTSNQGQFGGLGIVISIRGGQLTVISPIADTPADRAGFRAGDRIVKINDESTVNMPLDEAVSRLRGAPGTSVTVEVMRQGWTEPHSFNLVREVIEIDSVSYHALDDGIGYIGISNFQANTHDDLLAALADLETELGGVRGIVLDLRNNPGGLLAQAIRVSDTFLTEGNIVTTVGVGNTLREENVANGPGTQPNYPIAVLVNPGSASASEIVAGALKSHNRAVLIGDATFGKGSVQVLYELHGGAALKLTIAQYLTPGDVSIQGVGIVPDLRVVPVMVTDDLIDLYPTDDTVREGDLEASLTSDRVRGDDERPAAVVSYYHEPEEIDPEEIRDPDEFDLDFEIGFAQQVLAAAGDTWDRPTLLARVGDVVDAVGTQQMVAVQERLRHRNVDWTPGANVIQPLSMRADTDRQSGRVPVGDGIDLTVFVTNDGNRALHRVRAVSVSDYPIFDDHEFVFGRLEPGETREWTVYVEVPVEDRTRLDRVRFHAYADQIDLTAETEVFVQAVGQERPHWGFTYRIDDIDEGNGDGLLQVGETVQFVLDVTNVGRGDSDETSLYLRNKSENALFLRSGRAVLENVPAGTRERATFEFDVQSRPEEGAVQLEVQIYDTVFREYLSEELLIPVEESGAAIEPRSGRVLAGEQARVIHGGASRDSAPVATLRAGSELPVTGFRDGMLRVEWDDGTGWVLDEEVTVEIAAIETPPTADPLVRYQAPLISLDRDVVATDESAIALSGSVSDDRVVRDYYVVVQSSLNRPHSSSAKQVYAYVGVPSTTIDARIDLDPGINRVTVFARDDDKISSSEVVFVYRHE